MNASNLAHALMRAASRLISTLAALREASSVEMSLDAARMSACATEEDTLEMLREAHREPIAEAHYAAVRARVLSGIGPPACPRAEGAPRTWRILTPSLAIAAALLLAFWPKRELHTPPAQPVSRRLQAVSPVPEPPETAPAPRIAHIARPRRHLPSHAVTGVIGPPNPQPLVVKLLTNDPDVVIYWISERTGE